MLKMALTFAPLIVMTIVALILIATLIAITVSDKIKARRYAREVPVCYGYRRITCGKCRACMINETSSTLASTLKIKKS